jgi:putative transposase
VTNFRQDHPDGVILAVDQMSAYRQASLTRVWSPRGQTPVVGVTPQRDMLHFYGALDAIGGQGVALSLPKLDGDHTIHFLEHVMRCLPGRSILLLLDRAPWHKGKARRFIKAHPQLDLIYFPPGCPDLNPQEHVWKHTRDAVGHLRDSPHLGNLRRAFQLHLENTLFQFDWIDKYLPKAFYGFESI